MWNEIYGHEKNKEFLAGFLNEGKRTSSLLFFGLAGVGKKTIAHTFAQAFLCEADGAIACGHCPSCQSFVANAHPDFLLVEPKAAGKPILIEQIKEISQQAALSPRLAKRKICLLDGADYMTTTAANSLLKVLEEPPAYWLFVLIATNPERLLPTIRSRVIELRFAPLTEAMISKILADKKVPPAEAELAARLADGSAGEALHMVGQDILALREQALTLFSSLPTAGVLQLINRFPWPEKSEAREGLKLLELMIYILRDALLLKAGVYEPLYNSDLQEKIEKDFKTWHSKAIKNIIKLVQESFLAITANTSGKVVWEALLIKINLILKEDY
ncbi:MAG TPA: DNA polymerase III subunit delta' [Candidatus Avacidaminococcus intestinavium]|uniref:DNA polymerase III subunit delta' n=1 Tax=Candidatus Avacidaminococcus intestinavium TaxID=2840684 RepID=A0A9D1SLT5_9FIRM|nr:DNA polymerase III subunit delta' [Candidatus Avacidaminococcus intestinavium]